MAPCGFWEIRNKTLKTCIWTYIVLVLHNRNWVWNEPVYIRSIGNRRFHKHVTSLCVKIIDLYRGISFSSTIRDLVGFRFVSNSFCFGWMYSEAPIQLSQTAVRGFHPYNCPECFLGSTHDIGPQTRRDIRNLASHLDNTIILSKARDCVNWHNSRDRSWIILLMYDCCQLFIVTLYGYIVICDGSRMMHNVCRLVHWWLCYGHSYS